VFCTAIIVLDKSNRRGMKIRMIWEDVKQCGKLEVQSTQSDFESLLIILIPGRSIDAILFLIH